MAVFHPERKRNARGEQRQEELLQAAGRVFSRVGYHEANTNAIAAEAGVSPATLYQFFPNKEALANALTARHARQMAEQERAIDPEHTLPFADAIAALLESSLRFHHTHPEFHALLAEAPLSEETWGEKAQLADVFVGFIADRLRGALPELSTVEARHHGEVALAIFKGIIAEIAHAKPASKARWKKALPDAVLGYLAPVADAQKKAPR